jgi:hypothetical protein
METMLMAAHVVHQNADSNQSFTAQSMQTSPPPTNQSIRAS